MPPRFDEDTLTVDLGVADLLDVDHGRSVGFANRGGYERRWLGQAIHSRYQQAAEARDPTYRREVALSVELLHRGWTFRIRGRADGLRTADDGAVVVEEIKSVRRGGEVAPAVREQFARQALLYAWMLARLEEREVRAEIVLIEIGSDRVAREEVQGAFAALEGEVRRRLGQLLREHQVAAEARDRRRDAGERLAFPYLELRTGQQRIVDALELAIAQRDHLLVAAPTGIGKTVAALYPALRHALRSDGRVFVLTAKTLQQEMAVRVLEVLNQERSFHSLQLRAKAKMCANGEVICHEDYCPYARDYYGKLRTSRLLPTLLAEHRTLLPDTIHHHARTEEVCPFEVSLDLSREALVVVGDYNYAFDPYVSLSEFSPEADLSNTVIVVDEVHNLLERGRRYYSPELDTGIVDHTARILSSWGTPLHRELAGLVEELGRLIQRTVDDALPPELYGATEHLPPEDELWRLRSRFDAGFTDYLEHQRETKSFRPDDPFVDLYFGLLRFLDAMSIVNHAFVTLAERGRQASKIKVFCLDPSELLGRVLNRARTVVGLSATLSPPELYRDLLGFDPSRTTSLAIENPFPPEQRSIVIDRTVSTTYRRREENYHPIAARLGAFAQAVPGNCLALFPSYEFLSRVAAHLEVPERRVLVQRRADSHREREELLDTLRSSLFGDVLLLAVAGGVFAEGVDYPGDVLQAVAVVSPCLPPVTHEQELLRAYYDERFERGFEFAFVVPGMIRVVQAAGRLIRSPEDRGVIALFGRRFTTKPYSRHLPADWVGPDGSPKDLVGEPALVAARFFAGQGSVDRP